MAADRIEWLLMASLGKGDAYQDFIDRHGAWMDRIL